jgi:serine/threonine protein kinase
MEAQPIFPRLGRYEIVRRVGETGNVEELLGLAEDSGGRPCLFTLKVAQRLEVNAKDLADEMGREVGILERLHHPAIVRMVELFEDEQRLVLALEYVEGGSLDELLRARHERGERLPDAIALLVGLELSAALAHAHAAMSEDGEPTPVIHRNLHPSAVLVSLDGRVRLTGFGLGKILGLSPDTLVGMIKGSPGYMAPEQLAGERVTPRTDVYGIALLVASMLLGRSARDPAPSPDELVNARDDLPEGVLQCLATALEPSPTRRRTTCAEMEEWFAHACDRSEAQALLRDELRAFRGAPSSRSGRELAAQTPPPKPVTPPQTHALALPALPAIPTLPGSFAPIEEDAAAKFPPPLPAPPMPLDAPLAPEPEPDPAEFLLREGLREGLHESLHEGQRDPPEPPISTPPSPPVSSPVRLVSPGSRPLTTAGSLAVATFTAVFVVGAGLLVTEHDLRPSHVSALPAPALTASASATPSAKLVAPTRASASATTMRPRPPTNVPATASAALRPETLAANLGLLTVAFPTPGAVYLSGERVGVTNAPLTVRCGSFFLRVAEPAEGGPRWLSQGASVSVGCRAATRKDMGPLRIAAPETLGR